MQILGFGHMPILLTNFSNPSRLPKGVYSLGVTAASRDLIVSAIWMMDCADCGALLPQIAPPRLIDMGNSILLK